MPAANAAASGVIRKVLRCIVLSQTGIRGPTPDVMIEGY